MWILADFASPKSELKIMSFRSQNEFDCAGERMKSVAIAAYSGPMGSGDSIGSGDGNGSDWEPVVPDSVNESKLRYACEQLKDSDWIEMGKEAGMTIYSKKSSIEKIGGFSRVLYLFDYFPPKEFEGTSVMSATSRVEYACEALKFRLLDFTLYAGSRAGGSVVKSYNNGNDWQDIKPGSTTAAQLAMVCA